MEESRVNEDLKHTYLLCCPTCFSCRLAWLVPIQCLLKLGAWIKQWVGGKKFGGEDHWTWGRRRETESWVVVCYRDGDEIWRRGARGQEQQLACLVSVAASFPGTAYWCCRLGWWSELGKGNWEEKVYMMQGESLQAVLAFLFLCIVDLLVMFCIFLSFECTDSQVLSMYTLDTLLNFQKHENNFLIALFHWDIMKTQIIIYFHANFLGFQKLKIRWHW